MIVSYRIPSCVTGGKESNRVFTCINFFEVWLLWRKCKKEQGVSFLIYPNKPAQ